MGFNLYLGARQADLWRRKLYNSLWRFSVKRLNTAIAGAKDQASKQELIKVKQVYIVSLCVFYAGLLVVLPLIIMSWLKN